jgi:hypothetical protein
MANTYRLSYLPLFYDDMEERVAYLSDVLLNPDAANDLVDAVEKAILDRLPNAESFEKYHSRKERKLPYYRIYVKEYTIYYVVITDGSGKKIMEVRRILHNLQDRDQYI